MRHPSYELLQLWLKEQLKAPRLFDKMSNKVQDYTRNFIPSQIQDAIASAIEGFTKIVVSGSGFILPKLEEDIDLSIREKMAEGVIEKYRKLGMVSGAGTSAGGILTGLLDLPVLMSLKMRMIFEIGAIYGHDLKDPRERLYALLIFRMAFSSPLLKEEKVKALIHFETHSKNLESPLDAIDWQAFQLEYRDYIDLAKLMQFIPGIGIVIGATVNRKLLGHLGEAAMNGYRLRYFQSNPEKREI